MMRISGVWDRQTRKHVAAALFLGLILRLFFVLYLPTTDLDSELYEELSRRVVDNHVYAYDFGNGLVPTDIRVPGYPLFLGFVYLFSPSRQAILVAQALVDLGSCLLVAALAASVAPAASRRPAATAALWLSATCPFVANYAAVELTEVLATFFTTAALLILVWANQKEFAPSDVWRGRPGPGQLWFLGGVIVGLGALVRPELPITLAAPAVVLASRSLKTTDWPRLMRAGLLLAAGMFLALLPWAARNWITLHKVQFLTGRYFQSPGSYIPKGFYAWTHTWLVSYKDDERVLNRLEEAPLYITDFPPSAFDSPAERARVESLLEGQHRGSFEVPADADAQFSELARERTARHPFRTCLAVPLRRSLTLWFTPRTELLRYSGEWWPPLRSWKDYDADFAIGVLFAMLNLFYAGLALVGAFSMWRRHGVALLAAFLFARTFFIAVGHNTVEPRFVIPCVPAALALGALVWAKRQRCSAFMYEDSR